MKIVHRILSTIALASCLMTTTASADDRDDRRASGAIYNIAHFDVIPATIGSVDFLQTGYTILFGYRDASRGDPGLRNFRILNIVPPATNHSEIVQVWSSYQAYEDHLAKGHTIDFRFNVQGNPALANGICCIGSPIDDRQYSLVQSFNTEWADAPVSAIGPSGSLYVITYVELLQEGNVLAGQNALVAYGETTARLNGGRVQSFSVLHQIDRPNRYALLEIWDHPASYNTWQSANATTSFNAAIKPLLGSPLDHRLTVLCGATYVDNVGCTPP